MLNAAALPLLPPSGVTHSVAGHFSGSSYPKEVFVVSHNLVTLYRSINVATNLVNDQIDYQSSENYLEYIMEFSLYAPPVSIATCRPLSSDVDVVVLLFDDAHISFLRFNPKQRVFKTVALVQLLDRELLSEDCPLQPLLRVDTKGTYVAALVKRSAIVSFPIFGFETGSTEKCDEEIALDSTVEISAGVNSASRVQLSAWGDEEEEDTPLNASSSVLASENRPKESCAGDDFYLKVGAVAVTPLSSIRSHLRNVRDFQFVESRGEPLLAFLLEKLPTWAGRVKVLEWQTDMVKTHMLSCSLMWVSIAQSQSSQPKFSFNGEVEHLSYTTTNITALPSFAGFLSSVLCVSAHSVVWVGANRGYGVHFNTFGEEEVKELRHAEWTFQKIKWQNPSLEESCDLVKTNLNFANSAIIPLYSGQTSEVESNSQSASVLLITEENGTIVSLKITAESYAISMISADIIQTGCYCSSFARITEDTFFIGSCSSDSRVLLVKNPSEIQALQVFPVISPIQAATLVEDCNSSLFSSSPANASDLVDEGIKSSPYATLYNQLLLPSMFRPSDRAVQRPGAFDLAIAYGQGMDGSLCIMRHSIRDQEIPKPQNLPGTAVFVLAPSPVEAKQQESYLLITGPDFSYYCAVNSGVEQLPSPGLSLVERTLFFSKVDWIESAALQVTETEMLLVQVSGEQCYHKMSFSSLLDQKEIVIKRVFLVSPHESLFVLCQDGSLVKIHITANHFTASIILDGVTSAAYWKNGKKLMVVKNSDLFALEISNIPGTSETRFPHFAYLPSFIEENVEEELSPLPARLENTPLPEISDLLIFDHVPLGEESLDSCLKATLVCIVSSGELVTYNIIPRDDFGKSRLIKDIVYFLDVEREIDTIETVEARKNRLNMEQKRKEEDSINSLGGMQRLVEFNNIHQQSGVYACGESPVFLLFDSTRQRLVECRHDTQYGVVKSFSPFDSPAIPGGYVFCPVNSEVHFAVPAPCGSPIGNGWWGQNMLLGETPHHVLYSSEAQSCLVVTAHPEPFAPQKSPFDISLSITTIDGQKMATIKPHTRLPPLVSSGYTPVPLNDRFTLKMIFFSKAREELDEFVFEPNEKVLCAETLQLPYNQAINGIEDSLAWVYAFGTGFPLGEDVSTTGRLVLFTTRFDGERYCLQCVHSEPLKGPVTAITSVDRHIAIGVGGSIRVFKFDWKSAKCETVAMLNSGVYISSLSSFREYLFYGDLTSSVTMVRFGAANRSLHILGKHLHRFSVAQCEAMYHEGRFGLLTTDSNRNALILGYTPRVQEKAQGKKKVVLESLLSTDSEYRIPGGSITKLQRIRSMKNPNSSVMLYCTNYGEIGCFVPIGDLANRTVQWVIKRLQVDISHPCGLPSQVFLGTVKDHPKNAIVGEQRVVHAQLLQQLYRLDLRTRKVLAAAALTQLDKTLRIGASLHSASQVL